MRKIILKNKFTKRLNFGHLWVFSNELPQNQDVNDSESIVAGEIVDVEGEKGEKYGLAFYNPNSWITLRLLLTDQVPNKSFFSNRIKQALSKRLAHIDLQESDSFRVVFAEADFIPGLIVDKYANYLSIQILSAGLVRFKEIIIQSLTECLPEIQGIYEKSDSQTRKLEGLQESKGVIWGNIPSDFEILENSLKYTISFDKGQKTGYFLDQKFNRQYIATITKNKSVLDCYTNQGGFILNAAKGGAKSLTAIDLSKEAIQRAKENARSNNFDNISFQVADVPQFLNQAISEGKKWDIIILDPPSFAKSRKHIPIAKHAYAKINKLALQLLTPNGILISSSCTKHISEEDLFEIVLYEAQKQKKRLTLLHKGVQPPDHPYVINIPEINYLKFFVFQLTNIEGLL